MGKVKYIEYFIDNENNSNDILYRLSKLLMKNVKKHKNKEVLIISDGKEITEVCTDNSELEVSISDTMLI